MVFENGAGEGEPVVGFDLALPLVNLVVAADAAEFVEEFSEVGRGPGESVGSLRGGSRRVGRVAW